MRNVKLKMSINVPKNVTNEDIMKMLNFQFLGHAIQNEDIEKFPHECIDVEDYEIVK